MIRKASRVFGTLLVLAGLGMVVWSVVVWQWQDPVTSVYTHLEQRALERDYDRQLVALGPAAPEPDQTPKPVPEAAASYRASLEEGDVVGRLEIPRLGLTTMIVEGTEDLTLRRGPGRYSDLYLPGEGQLVYIAGHRTTYSAPFARIDHLRPGDAVYVDVPYGRFEYRIVRHRIVPETEVSVLQTEGEELLALQACHPRFFATHRYIAYAEPIGREGPQSEAAGASARG